MLTNPGWGRRSRPTSATCRPSAPAVTRPVMPNQVVKDRVSLRVGAWVMRASSGLLGCRRIGDRRRRLPDRPIIP